LIRENEIEAEIKKVMEGEDQLKEKKSEISTLKSQI
jgi:hypothetical protein